MNCKTLPVTTPESFRTLYFHLSYEKALAGRPKYYKMLLAHWNRESGYSTMSYEMFTRAIVHTRYLFSKLGRYATELIVAMSGSLPPYFPPLSNLAQLSLVNRPLLGTLPGYNEIYLINADQYALLAKVHVAMLSTEDYWRMRKFEYHDIFSSITDQEKEMH